jgi:hypothetical protein
MIPSQIDVVLRLAELSRLLETATTELATLDEKAVRAKAAHEVAYAQTFLASEGPVEARKHLATITVSDLNLEAELAAAIHRACRERIRTLGTQIDVGRTLSAATRQSFAAEAVGQTT